MRNPNAFSTGTKFTVRVDGRTRAFLDVRRVTPVVWYCATISMRCGWSGVRGLRVAEMEGFLVAAGEADVDLDRRDQLGGTKCTNFAEFFQSNSLREHNTHLHKFIASFLPKRDPSNCMQRPAHLRLRFPMPQLDIGSLAPGEPVVVQNSPYYAGVAPQDDAPQQVHSVAASTLGTGTAAATSLAAGDASDRAISTASTGMISTASTGSLVVFQSTSATAIALSSVTFSLASSASMASSLVAPSASASPSIPSSVVLAASVQSTLPASSSIAPSFVAPSSSSPSPSASPSPSVSPSPAALPEPTTHGATFYSAIALGTLILVACVATIIACLVRFRTRRREAAAVATIAWDPVVLDGGGKESTAPDLSLTGDRDVGEPKRSASFISSSASYPQHQPPPFAFETTYQPPPFDPTYAHPNPFVETAYYSPHQVPPLVDSAAYPLPPAPPRPPLTIPLSHDGGPYPTARPLPAYLADRDPHRIARMLHPSASSTTISGSGSGWRTAASSRNGSVRSHLPSATSIGRVRRLGVYPEREDGKHQDDQHNRPPHAQSVRDFGTPREREKRPRFMSLPSGRGLEVSWRRESFAVRGGAEPGWAHLSESPREDDGEQRQRWTQTLRASVLGAFHAVVGSPVAGRDAREEAGEEFGDEDGLTRAPSMQRRRREEGWRRFALREEADLERGTTSVSSSSWGSVSHIPGCSFGQLEPPAAALQHSGISMGTNDGASVRTGHSRVPLIQVARPRPAALVSRASAGSVYSTASASAGYGYRA
ncbi:hypothetical protein MVEN_01683700 [Mycena venus]|uniref:Uncharacterized protein n=1 Tax=Mycena venus TaxID=2733690 RepID=A0A8H6XNQ6_9AGAR|nr:hypothetical protein MVEN_01683700 [Mycena venus]